MRRMETIADWIDSATRKIGEGVSYLFLPMVAIPLTEVTLRYVFNSPTIWAWDVNVQLQAILVSLGGAYVFLSGRFIVVDVLVARLSRRSKMKLELATSVVGFFAIGMLTWLGAKKAWQAWLLREHSFSNWAPAVYPLRFLVLFGFFLLLLQLISSFCHTLATVMGEGESSAAAKHPTEAE